MKFSVPNLKHLAVTLPKVDCTGDVCTGDYVYFSKAVYTGTYPHAKFDYLAEMEGLVIADSYGSKKQQHTFTIELPDGNKMKIKGRNLYRNGCKRSPWLNENDRDTALKEKHERGSIAREAASARINGLGYGF